MTEVNITPFDNEISILYKWARYYRKPIRLIVIDTLIKGDKEVTNYSDAETVIANLYKEGKSLSEIFGQLQTKLAPEDVAIFYYLLSSRDKPIEEILGEINELYSSENIPLIKDKTELDLILADWKSGIMSEFKEDIEFLEEQESIHKELARYRGLLFSPIKVNKVTIKAAPVMKETGEPPEEEDGVILFDNSKPSYDIPYIKYNGNGKANRLELFKLYRGTTDETIPNYKLIIPPPSQTGKENSLYFTAWSGKGTLEKVTRESYMNGEYNVTDNILTVKMTAEPEVKEKLIKDLEDSLSLSVDNLMETAISGEFYLYDLDVNDIYLVDMILNTVLMNTYLFVKETNTPFAEKKKLKIYYKSSTGSIEDEEKTSEGYISNPASVSISLTQNRATGGEMVTVMMEDGPTKFQLPPDLPYVKVQITQAESLDVANRFVTIFSRLMNYYKQMEEETKRLFKYYIPEIDLPTVPSEVSEPSAKPLEKKISTKVKRKTSGVTALDRLKNVAPDLFMKGYARICQRSQHQPVYIPDDEVAEWKNQTFLYKNNKVMNRQVMKFPPDNPKWNFGCPNNSFPFPGVKSNNTLPNKEQYPCVPCCYKDNQMIPGTEDKLAKEEKCTKKKAKKKAGEKIVAKSGHKIKTNKILSPGGFGFLPTSIEDLVSKYSSQSISVLRMGTYHTPNSLLHCISNAIPDPNYLKLQTPEQKEAYVVQIRKIISQQVIPELMKQELYDFGDHEIREELENPKVFMDPNLFYRAIEQTYNINIYVFSSPDRNDLASTGSLQLPRFKLFHARSPRPDRRAVLIYRTTGSESDSLAYPQCELIVDRNESTNKTVTNFGKDMNSLLHNATMTINRTITWEIVDQERELTQIMGRENIYSRINYYILLNQLPTKQIIDGYGKTRAFVMSVGEEEMTVITPSTQPENLPRGEVTRIGGKIVTQIFGEPTSVTFSQEGVDGFWYKVLDLENGIYVPVKPTELYSDKPVGPNNPLVEEGVEVVGRIRKIRRDLETILQIIRWLFLVSKLTVPEFFNQYSIIGKSGTRDSATVYNLEKVGLKLPQIFTVEEGIKYLGEVAPTLIYSDRIFLYNQRFFDGVVYHLSKYDKERKPEKPKIPKLIYRSDINEEDFKQQKRVAIFTSERDMRTWLESFDALSFKNIVIENKLDSGYALRSEPYLYTAPDEKIYLIQNVIGGDKLKVINIAYNWYVHKINIGYRASEFPDPDNIPVHVIYQIGPSLSPVMLENNAGDSTNYLQLLTYGADRYAAMLPLL